MTTQSSYTVPEGVRLEYAIRRVLHLGGISLQLPQAAALLSIAIDHFADHELDGFLGLMRELHTAAAAARAAGAMCPECCAEMAVRPLDGARRCLWCDPLRPQQYARCQGCKTLLLWPSREVAPDQLLDVETLTLGIGSCVRCRCVVRS